MDRQALLYLAEVEANLELQAEEISQDIADLKIELDETQGKVDRMAVFLQNQIDKGIYNYNLYNEYLELCSELFEIKVAYQSLKETSAEIDI